jgi:hypothetical protein
MPHNLGKRREDATGREGRRRGGQGRDQDHSCSMQVVTASGMAIGSINNFFDLLPTSIKKAVEPQS